MYNNDSNSALPFIIVIVLFFSFIGSLFIPVKSKTYHCVYDHQVYSSGGSIQSKGTIITFTAENSTKKFVAKDNTNKFNILSPVGERNFTKLIKSTYQVKVYTNLWGAIIDRDFSAE